MNASSGSVERTAMHTALITGGSKGFGLALATSLVKDGWGVVIDGANRKFNYLTEDSSTLSIAADGTLTVSSVGAQKSLLLVERDSDGTLAPRCHSLHGCGCLAITIAPDVETLWAHFQEGDYTSVACRVPARRRVEVMDTGAACRTFNVLVGEQRRVVALLMV
jgi:NAD(P)-dependent dehydrogenase (short-subunit alcohol dehydrogenase family)